MEDTGGYKGANCLIDAQDEAVANLEVFMINHKSNIEEMARTEKDFVRRQALRYALKRLEEAENRIRIE